MNIQTSNIAAHYPLHLFDGKLCALQSLQLEMTELLMYQLEQTLHALDYADVDLALRVIARDRKVNDYQTRIEKEVRLLLAANCAQPNDLRTVTIISKMTDALEKIGNEIADFAGLIKSLYDHHDCSTEAELFAEVIKIGDMIKIMLDKMTVVLETRHSNQAYKLMQYGWNSDTRLQQSIEYQLTTLSQHPSSIDYTLNILQILKTLERCAGLCRSIAEYQILMLDSVDMRRDSTPAQACHLDTSMHLQQASF